MGPDGGAAGAGVVRRRRWPTPKRCPGRPRRATRRWPASCGIWLVPGSLYERDGDRIYNTAIVIDPAGTVVARYRKIFPFLPYETGVSHGTEAAGVRRAGGRALRRFDLLRPVVSGSVARAGMAGRRGDPAPDPDRAPSTAPRNWCWRRRTPSSTSAIFVDINNAGALGNGRSIVVGPEGDVRAPGRRAERGDAGDARPGARARGARRAGSRDSARC